MDFSQEPGSVRKSIAGQVTWLTGALGGIGSELTRQLLRLGAKVAATDLATAAEAQSSSSSNSCRVYPCDVVDRAAMSKVAQQIEDDLGPIDIAIFAAGVREQVKLDDFDALIHHRTMAVNYGGVVNGIEAILPSMLRRERGHLVLLGSLAAYQGRAGASISGYGPSKAALQNLAEGLYKKLARRGIVVTIVNSGFIDTDEARKHRPSRLFTVSTESAVARILRGIENEQFEIAFPRVLAVALRIARLGPRWSL
jgi:NAD(P)-dependent dehydrogenase (short-subunit alcohol dehydrogenase family)